MKVYIDTSVLGGYFDKEFSEWTVRLFKEFDMGIKTPVISDITIQELENAPANVKELLHNLGYEKILVDKESDALARMYLKEKIITPKYFNDALHIATATINHIDVLASWNFRHIVNLNRIRYYNSINLRMGYSIIEIRTPREIINEKN